VKAITATGVQVEGQQPKTLRRQSFPQRAAIRLAQARCQPRRVRSRRAWWRSRIETRRQAEQHIRAVDEEDAGVEMLVAPLHPGVDARACLARAPALVAPLIARIFQLQPHVLDARHLEFHAAEQRDLGAAKPHPRIRPSTLPNIARPAPKTRRANAEWIGDVAGTAKPSPAHADCHINRSNPPRGNQILARINPRTGQILQTHREGGEEIILLPETYPQVEGTVGRVAPPGGGVQPVRHAKHRLHPGERLQGQGVEIALAADRGGGLQRAIPAQTRVGHFDQAGAAQIAAGFLGGGVQRQKNKDGGKNSPKPPSFLLGFLVLAE
jgi:hypothetical protein